MLTKKKSLFLSGDISTASETEKKAKTDSCRNLKRVRDFSNLMKKFENEYEIEMPATPKPSRFNSSTKLRLTKQRRTPTNRISRFHYDSLPTLRTVIIHNDVPHEEEKPKEQTKFQLLEKAVKITELRKAEGWLNYYTSSSPSTSLSNSASNSKTKPRICHTPKKPSQIKMPHLTKSLPGTPYNKRKSHPEKMLNNVLAMLQKGKNKLFLQKS